MADVNVTAVQVPKKLFWVRHAERNEAGSVERLISVREVTAVSETSAIFAATVQAAGEGKFADVDDLGRVAVAVGAVTFKD